MNGEQRAARRALLDRFYGYAAPLYSPPEPRFSVITARKLDLAGAITRAWLDRHFPDRIVRLAMLVGGRTHERVIEYKYGCLRAWDIEDYSEDNRNVVRDLRKRQVSEGLRCRIWHYKQGKMLLDYNPGFV
jgi:hypothetical protein